MHKFIGYGLLLVMMMTASISTAQDDESFGYTYHHPSGNRVVEGRGTFPDVEQIEFQLASLPAWMVGVVHEGTARFVVVDGEGRATLLHSQDVALDLGTLPPGMPPLVHSSADGIALITPPGDPSSLSHPVPVADGVVYIANDGKLFYVEGERGYWRAINAMLDARPVVNSDGLIAVYTHPTNERYVHGIMGDDLEASRLALFRIEDGRIIEVTFAALLGTAVFEGLSPIWADVDGDGVEELIATVSDNDKGAQLIIYDSELHTFAYSDAIGQSNRWRHQIAWAALGENGEAGLVEVLTPHIGGVVGFFPLPESGRSMERTARTEGYTSHVIGSRNLDMAVIGDFNGDGQMEVVLPSQNRMRIAGLQIQGESFVEVWSLPLDGQLSTNLAAVTLPDGSLALGAGTEAGTVYVWLVP